MAELKPGKGAFLQLNQEVLEFLNECFTDMWNAAGEGSEQGTEEQPCEPSIDELQDSGNGMQYLKDIRSSATHWIPTQDKFGTKLHKALPWEDGEIRVTVVLKGNALKVDIRQWYDPESLSAQTYVPWNKR